MRKYHVSNPPKKKSSAAFCCLVEHLLRCLHGSFGATCSQRRMTPAAAGECDSTESAMAKRHCLNLLRKPLNFLFDSLGLVQSLLSLISS